jgi:hypothetical protein
MKSVKQIKEEINSLWSKIDRIKDKCKHLFVDTVLKSDTGNYDPTQDCYWKEMTCLTCEKQWNEDQ